MKNGAYEPGDKIMMNGKILIAEYADTDGSGYYVCDNGKSKCYFSNRTWCPNCQNSYGPRVIFLESDDNKGTIY